MNRTIELQTTKIIARVADGIGWLTINNPERRNAVSLDMWQGLGDASAAFEAADDVRVVVVHGAGGKAFAAGADISEFEKNRADAQQKQQYAAVAVRGQQGLAQLTKPLIAMIEGYCIGGGLALALSADLRFATRESQFGIPAAKLGLGYDYAGLAALARLVGPSTAKDMLFSARFLTADEALRVGLINFIVEDGQLHRSVSDYAARVAANAPPDGAHLEGRDPRVRAVFDRHRLRRDRRHGRPVLRQCRLPRRPPGLHGKAHARVSRVVDMAVSRTARRRRRRHHHLAPALPRPTGSAPTTWSR